MCDYRDCNRKTCIRLESVNCGYCEYHFKQVAYDMLGRNRLLNLLGRKKLKEWQKILGIVS
jgi:hypothetical protein